MYNFTGFSEKANMCLNKAVEVAEDSGHTYIGSEHVLLGLLESTDSVAGKILANRGVTYKKVYDLIRETVGTGLPTELTPNDFTPRSKHIIESALMLANSMKQALAGTEHLLISICREGNGYACQLLTRSGTTTSAILKDLTSATDGKMQNKNTKNNNGGIYNE